MPADAPTPLGRLGVWSMQDGMTAAQLAAFAVRVEGWGYGALWSPEGLGRDVLVSAGWVLANTRRLVVASGIANLYARDATAMAAARNQLNEQSDGRFLLGIGLSHASIVSGLRHHQYGKPIETMRAYLAAMAEARYVAPPPARRPLSVLAALGPRMLALSRDLADGAHTYNVTPEHTATARAILGPGKLLCVEQKVVLEEDPPRGRAIARNALAVYLPMPNYQNSWRNLGFTDTDFADGGTDRLMDAMVAWGNLGSIRARIEQHWTAGADHVCIQAIDPATPAGTFPGPDLHLLERLASLTG